MPCHVSGWRFVGGVISVARESGSRLEIECDKVIHCRTERTGFLLLAVDVTIKSRLRATAAIAAGKGSHRSLQCDVNLTVIMRRLTSLSVKSCAMFDASIKYFSHDGGPQSCANPAKC